MVELRSFSIFLFCNWTWFTDLIFNVVIWGLQKTVVQTLSISLRRLTFCDPHLHHLKVSTFHKDTTSMCQTSFLEMVLNDVISVAYKIRFWNIIIILLLLNYNYNNSCVYSHVNYAMYTCFFSIEKKVIEIIGMVTIAARLLK